MKTSLNLSPRTALWLFIAMIVFLFVQAVWWVVFIAQLVDEKVELAREMGASADVVARIHQEEISRQVMVGMEGSVFLVLLLIGFWLIYRSLVRQRELKFHQENFLMSVTHELKTPISSIRIYLDSLESPRIPEERKRTIIPSIRQDVQRLQSLVERALDAGRFDRSEYALNIEPFDLSDLLEKRVQLVRLQPQAKETVIFPEIASGIIVNGDSGALARAIDAVLENAVKYGRSGRVQIRVQLTARDGYAIVSIADDGLGIERKHLNAIFDRFFRAGSELTRTTDGSGLGLYLCREIIRAHGGTVTAMSDGPGKGSTFTLKLKRQTE